MEAGREQAKHCVREVKDGILGSPTRSALSSAESNDEMRTWLCTTCLKIAPCLVSHSPPATIPFLLTMKSAEKSHSPYHAGAAPLTPLRLSLHPSEQTKLMEAARDQPFPMLFTTHKCPVHQMYQGVGSTVVCPLGAGWLSSNFESPMMSHVTPLKKGVSAGYCDVFLLRT